MPNLTLQAGISHSLTYNRSSSTALTTTGESIDHRKIEIGTSEETVTIIGDITAGEGPGPMFIYNADSTNYVELGFATTDYKMLLRPSCGYLLPLHTAVTQLFMKANTAACEVEFHIREA